MPSIFSEDYDPDATTWTCENCKHAFTLWWNPDTFSMEPSGPLDPIVLDYACPDCLMKLEKSGLDVGKARSRRK